MIPRIIDDLARIPILMVAERGHSKSTSMKTILKMAKDQLNEALVLKIIDSSMSWFWRAPVQFRQMVTTEALEADRIKNIGSCTYEVARLSADDKRNFLATLVKQDFQERYALIERYGPEILDDLPLILYVLEEANTFLGSYSLRKSDTSAEVLTDFVSIGRNYKLNFIALSSALSGEISPSIRRRSALLVGRLAGESDLRTVKARTSRVFRDQVKKCPRFHWVYWSGGPVTQRPVRIPDICKRRPRTFETPRPKAPTIEAKRIELVRRIQGLHRIDAIFSRFVGLVLGYLGLRVVYVIGRIFLFSVFG